MMRSLGQAAITGIFLVALMLVVGGVVIAIVSYGRETMDRVETR